MRSTERCARLTQSSRLRSGAASPVSTCMSTPSCVADHAARIANAALAVEREAGRQRMHDLALGLERLLGAGGEHALDVGRLDLMAAEIDGRGEGLALQPAGGDVDDQRIDGEPGHALGRIDGEPDRLLGLVEIDDDAGLHAARLLVADADDLDLMGAAAQQLALARAASAGRSCSRPCSSRCRAR